MPGYSQCLLCKILSYKMFSAVTHPLLLGVMLFYYVKTASLYKFHVENGLAT